MVFEKDPINPSCYALPAYSNNFSNKNYISEFQFGKTHHVTLTQSGQLTEFVKAPIKLSYDDLRAYTNNFSDENYISDFQFGKIYHGKITLPGSENPKPVTVKIWGIPNFGIYRENENRNRLIDEVVFLEQQSHPGLVKLYGYCCEFEKCGVVYDFKSLNTVQNLTKRDEFKWWQRMKVALKFAQLLKFLLVNNPGEKPFVIRNISPAHIMVDEDWNPKLYDFGMITGGRFPDRTRPPLLLWGCFGFLEPLGYMYTPKSDVYAFGVILLSLIMKETYTDEDRENSYPTIKVRAGSVYHGYSLVEFFPEGVKDKWCKGETAPQYDNYMFTLVHESFGADESFCASDGPTITRLALACSEYYHGERLSIHLLVHRFQKLKVVRRHLNHCIERKVKSKKF